MQSRKNKISRESGDPAEDMRLCLCLSGGRTTEKGERDTERARYIVTVTLSKKQAARRGREKEERRWKEDVAFYLVVFNETGRCSNIRPDGHRQLTYMHACVCVLYVYACVCARVPIGGSLFKFLRPSRLIIMHGVYKRHTRASVHGKTPTFPPLIGYQLKSSPTRNKGMEEQERKTQSPLSRQLCQRDCTYSAFSFARKNILPAQLEF